MKLRDQSSVFILVGPSCETQRPGLFVYTCGPGFWKSGTIPVCLYLWALVVKLRDQPSVFILVGSSCENQGPVLRVYLSA